MAARRQTLAFASGKTIEAKRISDGAYGANGKQ